MESINIGNTVAKQKNKEEKIDAVKSFMAEMNDTAESLYKVRSELNNREEKFKKETDEMYNLEALLKSQLLEKMKAVGMKSVKVESGDSWIISKKPAVEILNEAEFTVWAIKNKLIMPDKTKIKNKLQTMVKNNEELPLCVEFTNNDSISIRKQKENVGK